MSTVSTTQELKDYADLLNQEVGGKSVLEVFHFFAESINAEDQGYKIFKALVKCERFNLSESVNEQSGSGKFNVLLSAGFGSVTVQRMSTGQYRVTTSFNNANSANLLENGLIQIQFYQDIPSNNQLRSGDAVFVGSDVSISSKTTFISEGVFDVYIVASKGTQNETLVDCNFYLNIELFNVSN